MAVQDSSSKFLIDQLIYMATIFITIFGSIYLVSLKNTRSETILQHQQEAIRFLNDAVPIIRSSFDVYLWEKSLIYVRDYCDSEDTNIGFFLHIVPISQSDIPHSRKQYGFDNLDFEFKHDGFFDGQRCIVVRHLPRYGIAKITTGQSIRNRRNGTITYTQIWNGTFRNVR